MVRSGRFLGFATSLFLLLLAATMSAAGTSVEGVALVLASDGAQVQSTHGLDVVESHQEGDVETLVVQLADGQSVSSLRQSLAGDLNVYAVDEVTLLSLQTPEGAAHAYFEDPDSIASDSAGGLTTPCIDAHLSAEPWAGWGEQAAALLTHVGEAQAAVGHCGEGVTVAVIDTGLDADHPLLQGAVLPGYDFLQETDSFASEWSALDASLTTIVEGSLRASAAASLTTIVEQSMRQIVHENAANVSASLTTIVEMGTISVLLAQADASIVEDLDVPPLFGHGTMVAGLIRLVAPGAQILPLRVFDGHGIGDSQDVVRAIYLATNRGADVINMSFSMERRSPAVSEALRYARQHGVVVVAAAGNRGTNDPTYPASDSKVIGVASSDLADVLADFSNYGANNADLVAPGVALISSYPGGHYAAGWGTSFSTPLVAGAAALMRFGRPDTTATQRHVVESILTGVEFVGLQGVVLTGGRLDVEAAVQQSLD